jgi:hypothetical protein
MSERPRTIVAFAPAFAGSEVDLVRAQEAPDVLHIDVAEGFGNQRPIPTRVARGNRPVEHGQNARVGGVGRVIAAIARLVDLLFYVQYYKDARTHLSLNKDAPVPRAVQAVWHILPAPILGGLHHH